MAIAQLERFRMWRNTQFTGRGLKDIQERYRTITAVREMMADSLHNGGVRIKFGPAANYSSLVFALDLMERERVQKYRLDLQHKPATLYAYTYVRPRPSAADTSTFIYGEDYYIRRTPEPSPASALTSYVKELLIKFCQPNSPNASLPTDYSMPAVLLFLILALNTWQIGRAWSATRQD